jgi:hypothetical protein
VARRTPSPNSLRPWPFLATALVCFSTGTALLSSEEGRTAAGEALIIMGIILIGSWVTMLAAQSPMQAVRGWREREDTHDDDEPRGD